MRKNKEPVKAAFIMGMGVYYLISKEGGLLKAVTDAIRTIQDIKDKEAARIVDPYNREVIL